MVSDLTVRTSNAQSLIIILPKVCFGNAISVSGLHGSGFKKISMVRSF